MFCGKSALYTRVPIKRLHVLLRSSTHALSSARPCLHRSSSPGLSITTLRCLMSALHCSASHRVISAIVYVYCPLPSHLCLAAHPLTPLDSRGGPAKVRCNNSRATRTSSSASPAPSTVR